jgi:Tfp pilus assembly protein PilF
MKKWELKTFIEEFCDDTRKDKQYCFILGAGASRQSGIPTGGELAKEWIEDLKKRFGEAECQQWMADNNISSGDLAKDYSKIYEKRFEANKNEGYIFLEELIEKAEPSIGYSILAQILTRSKHNLVITTNFDHLIEDALSYYIRTKPLIIGHESLAHFIIPFKLRPTIVKIHRDLYYSPFNDVKHTSSLADEFTEYLPYIFKHTIPIFIGYGGNDGSLMSFLEGLKEIGGKLFWLFYEKNEEPSGRIKDLIEKHNGFAVPIPGFDETMLSLGNELDYELFHSGIVDVAKQRSEKYINSIHKLVPTLDLKKEIKTDTDRQEKENWLYELDVALADDIDEKGRIYREGLTRFPDSIELINNYALFLKDKKKAYDEAENLFKIAIVKSPSNAKYLYYYAEFLLRIKKDYYKAEKYLIQALEQDPFDPRCLELYAHLLYEYRKDFIASDKYYRRAISNGQTIAYIYGNYARFLLNQKRYNESKDNIIIAFILNKTHNSQLEIELWFYRYAVFYKEYPESKSKIEELLKEGVRSPGWNLDGVLAVAKELGHPDYAKLEEFARDITKEE